MSPRSTAVHPGRSLSRNPRHPARTRFRNLGPVCYLFCSPPGRRRSRMLRGCPTGLLGSDRVSTGRQRVSTFGILGQRRTSEPVRHPRYELLRHSFLVPAPWSSGHLSSPTTHRFRRWRLRARNHRVVKHRCCNLGSRDHSSRFPIHPRLKRKRPTAERLVCIPHNDQPDGRLSTCADAAR